MIIFRKPERCPAENINIISGENKIEILGAVLVLLSVVCSVSVITLYAVVRHIKKERRITAVLYFTLNISVLLFLFLAGKLSFLIGAGHKDYYQIMVLFLEVLVLAWLFYGIIRFSHEMLDFGRRFTFLFRIISVGFITGILVVFPLSLINKGTGSVFSRYFDIIVICVFAVSVYSLVLCFIRRTGNGRGNSFGYLLFSFIFMVLFTASLRLSRLYSSEKIPVLIITAGITVSSASWLVCTFIFGLKVFRQILDARIPTHIGDDFHKKYRLSSREAEVARLLFIGRTNKEIADELSVSLATVKTHTNRIYRKTETGNRIELLHRINQGEEP